MQAYDNAKILTEIISRVGTDTEAIKNELYKIKDYSGVSGKITIDSNGDLANAEYQLRVIRNGNMENA